MPLLPLSCEASGGERAQATVAARQVVQGRRVEVRVPGAEVGERRVCAKEAECVNEENVTKRKSTSGRRRKISVPPFLVFLSPLFDEMAAKPPADPLKGHDRYKKIKDLNQGKEREA